MTSSLAGLIVLLPQWWTNIGLDPTQQPALLIRLLLLSTVLFLGSFICLVLVTRAYNAQTKSHTAEIEEIRKEYEKRKDAEKAEDFFVQQINYPENGIV